MNTEIRRKRDLLHQRQVIAHNNLDQLRHQAKASLGTPPVLFTAFAVGYFARVIGDRGRPVPATDGREPDIKPITRRITVLGGALLGTALRSGLRGAVSDLFRSSTQQASNRSEHA